jgi:isocitrate lyase
VQNVQRKEETHKVDQLLHQKWSGADYVDQLQKMVNPRTDSLSQNEDSTEKQFGTKHNQPKI